MTVKRPRSRTARSGLIIRRSSDGSWSQKSGESDVPAPVKKATEQFIKKYRRTLRDLEKQ